ncbi:hypothetical protein VAL12_006984 [Pseudomonas aeruginosa]|nr:hypothetical protein [Pseudomonas aeruginosa]EMB9912505.1 hypothetical protein [Pseudomonas aeruginosa]
MNNQQQSKPSLGKSTFSQSLSKQKSVAQLLDDKAALEDWSNNIEKIRQKEVAAVAEQIS